MRVAPVVGSAWGPAMCSTDDQEDHLRHGRIGEGEQSAAGLPAAVWRATSIVGICLIIIGIAVGYVDYSFQVGFLSDHFNIF